MTTEIQKRENQNVSEIFNSRAVAKTLLNLMDRVTEKECSSDTVNAACNCATQIINLIKVHLEVERLNKRVGT